ncbi:MAG: hypothetical protein DRP89_09125 [Candidatus Neomarinimicrobiota bacterium]|nr:MAG: hypothetical protein DRP89_09125 [Candidatus Neomarinimicrobiota bacterium]
MRLSTKGRYGTRLMLQLTLKYGDGPILLKDIGAKEGISVRYLEHLIPPLKSARLINSTRGAHGGYTLSKAPSEINLKEIVEALEGTLVPSECINAPSVCERASSCVSRNIWKMLGENIAQTLESITLENMLEMMQKKSQNDI